MADKYTPVVTPVDLSKKDNKKGNGFFNSLFKNPDIPDLCRYMIYDVTVPVIKRAMSEMLTKYINGIFGTNVQVPYLNTTPITQKTNYNGISTTFVATPAPRLGSLVVGQPYDFVEIPLQSQEDCEKLIWELGNIVAEYSKVRVSEVYEKCGRTAPFTCNDYGWDNVNGSVPHPIPNGWGILFPPLIDLRR